MEWVGVAAYECIELLFIVGVASMSLESVNCGFYPDEKA
jgi:hypothetical protein